MEWPVLKAFCYQEGESRDAKKLRRQGYVPFSVYHKNCMPSFYKTKDNELTRFFVHNPGKIHLELDIEGEENKKVVFKEIQRDPVKDNVIHMDMYEVTGDTSFKVRMPIKFVGTAEGVLTGGSFERQIKYLNIQATPQSLPDAIEVDVTSLKVGDCMYLENLPVPEGIKFLDQPRRLICNVVTTRASKQATTTETEEKKK